MTETDLVAHYGEPLSSYQYNHQMPTDVYQKVLHWITTSRLFHPPNNHSVHLYQALEVTYEVSDEGDTRSFIRHFVDVARVGHFMTYRQVTLDLGWSNKPRSHHVRHVKNCSYQSLDGSLTCIFEQNLETKEWEFYCLLHRTPNQLFEDLTVHLGV
jgi:hypothetical protein